MITKELVGLAAQVLADPVVASGTLVLVWVLIGGWLLAILWCFQDSARRSDSFFARYLVATWILASGPLLMPLSVGVYALVRPADTPQVRGRQRLAEVLQAREAEDGACFACGGRIEAGWIRCPACASWLATQCGHCERWAPPSAEICPWCTAELGSAPDVNPIEQPERKPVAIGDASPPWRAPGAVAPSPTRWYRPAVAETP